MCYIRGLDTSGVAIGTIQDFGQAPLPFGFVAIDGSVVSQTGTYAKLFAKIGATFNTGGEGAGNFRLPNKIGRASVMPGTYTDPVSGVVIRTAGQQIGAEKHALTTAEGPAHSHVLTGSNWMQGAVAGGGVFNDGPAQNKNLTTNPPTSSSGTNTAHNNMQPSLVVGNVGIAYL